MTNKPTNRTARIAELNDNFRRMLILQGLYFYTRGIADLPPEDKRAVIEKVKNFDDFSEDNDPYGEHDFGAFTHNGNRIFWKIDYYAPGMERGSDDPADPAKTMRVLTILLADEY